MTNLTLCCYKEETNGIFVVLFDKKKVKSIVLIPLIPAFSLSISFSAVLSSDSEPEK